MLIPQLEKSVTDFLLFKTTHKYTTLIIISSVWVKCKQFLQDLSS